MSETPKVWAAVVAVKTEDDLTSVANAAASAALEVLRKVSARDRGAVILDRVTVVNVEPVDDPENLIFRRFNGKDGGQAVIVTCRHRDEPADHRPTDSEVAK